MDCAACGTGYSKPFWRCPACGSFNFRRLGWWAGLILAPWVYLAMVCFRGEILFLLGLTKDFQQTDRLAWIGCFYPLAGVPFIWFTQASGLRKLGLSLAYVIFCYGLPVAVMLLLLFLSFSNCRWGL